MYSAIEVITADDIATISEACQFLDVTLQFVEAGPAAQREADHLESPLRRSAARVNQDQQAGDDRAVSLDPDAILFCTEQVPAARQLPEHSKEQLDQPAMPVQLRDQFGRNVRSAGGNTQHSITARTGAGSTAAARVRCCPDTDKPDGVIRL